jgi:hypothetical protein
MKADATQIVKALKLCRVSIKTQLQTYKLNDYYGTTQVRTMPNLSLSEIETSEAAINGLLDRIGRDRIVEVTHIPYGM